MRCSSKRSSIDAGLRLLYNVLFAGAGAAALPFFMLGFGKYRLSFKQKLGFYGDGCFPKRKKHRIWVHAVSVGEVMGAAPVVKEIRRIAPEADIFVSTGTVSGQQTARKVLGGAAEGFFYGPLDFTFSAGRAVERVSPDVFIALESEIWPELLWRMKKRGTKLFLINGRISAGSFRLYYASRFIWGRVLNLFDCIVMASERDYLRVLRLGAASERVRVLGNSKYDALEESTKAEYEKEMRGLYPVRAGESVFILASLHPGEFRAAACACSELRRLFPDLLFIVVPRHPRRAGRLASVFREYGFECFFRSRAGAGAGREDESVIIVDVIGELFKLYSLADIVFCGGSLVPAGGQNILEPAAWGKPVIVGPYTEDFHDCRELLAGARACFTVETAGELAETAGRLLSDSVAAAEAGSRGKSAVSGKKGAAKEMARLIKQLSGL